MTMAFCGLKMQTLENRLHHAHAYAIV